MPSSRSDFQLSNFLQVGQVEQPDRQFALLWETSESAPSEGLVSSPVKKPSARPGLARPAAPSAPPRPQECPTAWVLPELAFAIHARDSGSSAHSTLDWLAETQTTVETALAQAQHNFQDSELTLRSAQQQAAEILSQTSAQAGAMLQQAETQAAAISAQARAEGIAAAEEQTANLIRSAHEILNEVKIWRDHLLTQGEMMMLRLVIEVAQSIFGAGVPLDPETLGQAFTRALTEARTLGGLRVHIHPEDAAILGPHWVKQQEALSGQRIELVPSDLIKRGGCFVEGQFGSVDARLDTQLQLVEETLLSTLETSRRTPTETNS